MTDDRSKATSQPVPDVDHLASALRVTEGIIAGVRPGQEPLPTPCPEYDTATLLDHLVGFATSFADKATGVTPPADPMAVRAGDDPQAAYHSVAARLLDGYRSGAGGDAATPIGVVLMETVTHGWDLARATGQPTPYEADAVEAALGAGRGMLAPQFRGDGKPFGDEVKVPDDAPALDRLVAFMGRDPDWVA